MKTIEELNKRKAPVVRIDESLDRYDNVVLFPEKLAKANDILKISGLPGGKKRAIGSKGR